MSRKQSDKSVLGQEGQFVEEITKEVIAEAIADARKIGSSGAIYCTLEFNISGEDPQEFGQSFRDYLQKQFGDLSWKFSNESEFLDIGFAL